MIGEWGDAGVGEVAPLRVHHADDEAWARDLRGASLQALRPRGACRGGSTVFVPAGAAHTFGNAGPGAVRYLIVTTSRPNELIAELHRIERAEHPAVVRKYKLRTLRLSLR